MTARRTPTALRERRIIMAQLAEGYARELPDFGFVLLCACGCGTPLRANTPVSRAHIMPCAPGSVDDETNIRLYFKPCANKKNHGGKSAARPGPGRRLEEMRPSEQARILCADPVFREFLAQAYEPGSRCDSETEAARAVRSLCNVSSRSCLDESSNPARLWGYIRQDFSAWKIGRRPAARCGRWRHTE